MFTKHFRLVSSLVFSCAAFLGGGFTALPAAAKVFYVDPNVGSAQGDGSAAKPWRTIQEVIDAKWVETRGWDALPYKAGGSKLIAKNAGAPIHAGDTIYLRSGFHGALTIRGYYNANRAASGAPSSTARSGQRRIGIRKLSTGSRSVVPGIVSSTTP